MRSVRLLLKGGADVHALNKWRETPLLTAANHGQSEAVEALLEYDADPCKCTDTGWSPLSIAAYKGHDACVRMILEDGAPTEEEDPTLSALLQAATKGLPDTVKLLLRHGADHTVTTKKGDTALSILVEQNLIDAAAEMVTEYNASILRCSRDRKKVQRARLLINLRLKQMERDKDNASTDEDSEASETAHVPQHLEAPAVAVATAASSMAGGSATSLVDEEGGVSAEEKARAAEEALLLELQQEDEQAKRDEEKANYKQAKKKKKRERERLQKMKEEEERKQRSEEEAKKRERQQKEREEKERKQRVAREKAEKEQMLLEQEKMMEAKRKERELREQAKKDSNSEKKQAKRNTVSPDGSKSSVPESNVASRASTDPTPNRKIVSPKGGKKPMTPLPGNRRWEKTASSSQQTSVSSSSPSPPVMVKSIESSSHQDNPIPTLPQESESPASSLAPRYDSEQQQARVAEKTSPVSSERSAMLNSPGGCSSVGERSLEHPAVAVFRQEKVIELCRRSAQVPSLVSSQTLKRVVYRWILRASHVAKNTLDPIIPSWVNDDHLVDYFQRQFIAESRWSGVATGLQNMEVLKEAGTWVAKLCRALAEDVVEFSKRSDTQLGRDWSDTDLHITAESTISDSGPMVVVTWKNRANAIIPEAVFVALRDRFIGLPTRFLTSVFVSKTAHDTVQFIVSETGIDLSLPQATQLELARELEVSGDLCSNPFSIAGNSVYWGQLGHVDGWFGGLQPFGNGTGAGDQVVFGHGGSFAAFLPGDALVAGNFVKRIVDILGGPEGARVPLSFCLFLTTDCFTDRSNSLTASDLFGLDSRLANQSSGLISRIEQLRAGEHAYCSLDGHVGSKLTSTDSIFVVLQNPSGRSRYTVDDIRVSRVLSTLASGRRSGKHESHISGPVPIDFRESPLASSLAGYVEAYDPISPQPQRVPRTDFGAIGDVASISSHFSPSNERGAPRCGRLFDLVDNADDEHLADDLVHGMLNNLDVGLFQQDVNVPSDNVDIEAISLMGIGSSLPSSHHTDRSGARPFR